MKINLNDQNEIEYHFDGKLSDEQADVAAFILSVAEEYEDDREGMIIELMNELGLMVSEANKLIDSAINNKEFEDLIYDWF